VERIQTPDGAVLAVHSVGAGPGIVVVHGGGVTIASYRRFATRLADHGFAVHLYNRRGRADAPPRADPYAVEQEVDDLAVVLESTGARNVIGHSGGGLISIRAALRLPVDRLALYDAAVSINGGFPVGWLDAAREAVRAGDTARALAITGAGINVQSPASKLPLGVRTAICRLFMRTPIGRTMGELLPTTLDEADQTRLHDGPASQFAGITAEVLLACGADGPPYYVALNDALVAALPRARAIQIPRGGHDAINRAPARLIDPVAEFFAPRTDD
jgi:pimeloyl-ACP methyl ester carboxylesterase